MVYKWIFIFIFSIAALERIFFTFKRKKVKGEVKYRWTTYSLISSYVFCILVALFEFAGKASINYRVSIAGVLVAGAGMILRRAAIQTLGDFWSIHIKIFNNQPIIKSGPYRFFRHPYYAAVMLELIGVSLFFNASGALLIVFLIHFPLLVVRILLEERILTAALDGRRDCHEPA